MPLPALWCPHLPGLPLLACRVDANPSSTHFGLLSMFRPRGHISRSSLPCFRSTRMARRAASERRGVSPSFAVGHAIATGSGSGSLCVCHSHATARRRPPFRRASEPAFKPSKYSGKYYGNDVGYGSVCFLTPPAAYPGHCTACFRLRPALPTARAASLPVCMFRIQLCLFFRYSRCFSASLTFLFHSARMDNTSPGLHGISSSFYL